MTLAVAAAVEIEEACKLHLLTNHSRPRLLRSTEIIELTGSSGTIWDL